jgi:hypothetical protein
LTLLKDGYSGLCATFPVVHKQQGWYYTEEAHQVKHAYEMVLSGESLNDVGKGNYVCIGHYKGTGCPQRYTRIADMESRIDNLIGGDMADPAFLRRLAIRLQSMQENDKRVYRIQQLEREQKSLERKRSRVSTCSWRVTSPRLKTPNVWLRLPNSLPRLTRN